jgi:hypothetical protein
MGYSARRALSSTYLRCKLLAAPQLLPLGVVRLTYADINIAEIMHLIWLSLSIWVLPICSWGV